jgi:DNA-binding LacI/PurR family transcriptional regulator
MEGAGHAVGKLAYHPQIEPKDVTRDSRGIACHTAGRLTKNSEITAVVAANDLAALGLLDALQAAGIPREHWPAIVGFDNLPIIQGQILTSLRLPAEGLGRAAADLLWERHHGVLTGPPVHRHVPMSLLPRLTSRAGWSVMAEATLTTL